VQLVLHRLEEQLRDLGILVVVDAALFVDVRNLEIEASFAGADGANPLQEFIKVVFAETLALFKTFIVEHKSFDEVLAQNLCSPDAKSRCLADVDPVADPDDGIHIVEVYLAGDRPRLLDLNYPIIPDSCRSLPTHETYRFHGGDG